VNVDLSASDVRHAALVGVGRDLAAKAQNRRPLYGGNTLIANIVGALGELTVAKALGVFWNPNVGGNDHDSGDVGPFEVRTTNRSPAFLTVRERDDDARPVVLVTGQPPCMRIEGWIWAAEAKREDWRENASQFKVPAIDLYDWSTHP
jgi:hypothetical protein